MTPALVNINSLVGLPAEQQQTHGLKTAGVVSLLEMQPGSPVPYRIPSGYSLAAGQHANLTDSALRSAVDDLSREFKGDGVLLARSSAIQESPGQNSTLFVPYHHRDPDGSFHRFREAVHQVGSSKADMGVLMMPLVGRSIRLRDGQELFGFDNVSFVADSHHPLDPREIYAALVHGLGTRAVDVSGDFIPLTARRSDGIITSIGNKSALFISTNGNSVLGATRPENYRQMQADGYSLVDADLVTTELEMHHPEWWLNADRFTLKDGKLIPLRRVHFEQVGRGFNIEPLGILPLVHPAAYANLISILNYVSLHGLHPRQIEGAFLSREETITTLYQMIDVPEVSTTLKELDKTSVHLTSEAVIGSCDFKGPLIWTSVNPVCFRYPSQEWESLRRIEERYGKDGYALVAEYHSCDIINATPNCRIRISLQRENLSTHAVTLTRLKLARNPQSGLALGIEVKIAGNGNLDSLRNQFPSEVIGYELYLFPRSRVQANSDEMVVSLNYRQPSGSWWDWAKGLFR